MLWVLLFIAGLVLLLAGVMPLILRGPRLVNSVFTSLGLLAVIVGGGGAILKPRLPGFDIAALPSPQPIVTEPIAVDPQPAETAFPDPAPVAPPAAQPAADPAASKDESQLAPNKMPAPVSVTTTTVVGTETDPLAATPPAGAQQPASPDATAAVPAPQPAPEVPAPPPAPPQPSEAEKLAALADKQSRDETAFIKAVGDARTAYEKAGDDDRVALQSSRAAAICAAVKKPEVNGWVGAIREVERDPGGRTILSVALPDGTLVKTWNNAMSDIEDKTLILAGTPLAAAVGKLAKGDAIRFSGTFFADEPDCYRSSRLSLDQSMTEPSFLFRFTSLEKL
ncbi:hypothetical protein OSH08_15170 [Kaistia geumhonensis]|uniref:Uncharacterized protein n=1 Tax=Kaistia geumhonensis TaxID=410839 RepID=A0ABU0M0D0_9HYPH|nr:hypothetical protein [Kaistia geumhonensis]MCX5480350.1 hypothetical protein [Kaistia geumhonensis]MDQ0514417.1 hypothetical protein [Kaistia geumhonensis]